VIGPSFSALQVPDVIEKIVSTFTDYRESDESFVQTLNRIGLAPFKERVYQREPSEATL